MYWNQDLATKLKAVGKQGNLYEAVAEHLRQAIMAGELKPGQTLPNETELASQLAVSRPVVREALRFLQAQGLVRIIRGTKGGAVVGALDHLFLMDNIPELIKTRHLRVEHLLQVRLVVEPEIWRLAAVNATEEDLAALEEIIERTEAETDLALTRQLNGDFHRLVGSICGNPIFQSLMNRILDFTLAFVDTLRPEHVLLHKDGDHRILLQALRDRDPEEAARLIQAHVTAINDQIKMRKDDWMKMEL